MSSSLVLQVPRSGIALRNPVPAFLNCSMIVRTRQLAQLPNHDDNTGTKLIQEPTEQGRDQRPPDAVSRKVGYFLQVLDFEPRVLDGHGKRRPPSEFKGLRFRSASHSNLILCCLNANLFYWFVTVFSDCRHVNRREVAAFPTPWRWLPSPPHLSVLARSSW